MFLSPSSSPAKGPNRHAKSQTYCNYEIKKETIKANILAIKRATDTCLGYSRLVIIRQYGRIRLLSKKILPRGVEQTHSVVEGSLDQKLYIIYDYQHCHIDRESIFRRAKTSVVVATPSLSVVACASTVVATLSFASSWSKCKRCAVLVNDPSCMLFFYVLRVHPPFGLGCYLF